MERPFPRYDPGLARLESGHLHGGCAEGGCEIPQTAVSLGGYQLSIIWNRTLLIDMYISIICQLWGGNLQWFHWGVSIEITGGYPPIINKPWGINPELTASWGYTTVTTLLSVASWNIHENPGSKWRMKNHRTKSWNFQQATLDYQRVTYNWGSLIIYLISLIVIDIYICIHI